MSLSFQTSKIFSDNFTRSRLWDRFDNDVDTRQFVISQPLNLDPFVKIVDVLRLLLFVLDDRCLPWGQEAHGNFGTLWF